MTEASTVVFEGTPERFDLKWNLLTAKEGELIPADPFGLQQAAGSAHMVITFRVQRTYKGNLGSEVQLQTGLGGGDCAATYATGLKYLVFAYGPSLDQLGVSMCSPGGWIDGDIVATDLRYLRKERPLVADLTRIRGWSQVDYDKQAEQRRRAAEEWRKKYSVATGRICGKVIRPDPNGKSGGGLGFLSTQGYSPVAYPDASLNEDGSFCSANLGPGQYYLYFVRGQEQPEALYYPGVTDVAKAVAIQVTAGQTIANLVFKTSAQSAYSVRGFVSADQWPHFASNVGTNDITVLLIRTDGDRRVWYSEKVTLILPRLGYFKFDNVVPGQYAACVQAPGPGWMTKRVDVSVTSHMKFIMLDLIRKK
jgi:hypothetical protein